MREVLKTCIYIAVGLTVETSKHITTSPRFQKMNPFACGVTVLGTGSVKRKGDIHIHDHPLFYPNTGTIVDGSYANPLAAYVKPGQGLIIETYDYIKHGNIDYSVWNDPSTTHKHLKGGACVP